LYGSYNFSASAQKQDNIAVYTNDPGEVQQAMDKFAHDWDANEQKTEWQITPTHPPIAAVAPAATPEASAAVAQAAVPHIAEGAPA
jgi:hypothetical protein